MPPLEPKDQPLRRASDGLPARVVGPWSPDKLEILNRYMDAFSVGMRNKWDRRVYIDLMSGPGLCIVRGSGREILGSPLLALNPEYPFTEVLLNDRDRVVTDALMQRAAALGSPTAFSVYNRDCNDAARNVVPRLFTGSTIGLAFIDPTGFQIDFDAIADMTRDRRVDLIITVMTGYLKRFVRDMDSRLDAFFGDPSWRSELTGNPRGLTFRTILDYFEKRLRDIGYADVDDDIRMSNSRNSTIYHLVFASKHPRGLDLYRKVSAKPRNSQLRFKLE